MVTICTASLTFNNYTFCPHSVFMCFVWIWEQTAIISLYSINWLVFSDSVPSPDEFIWYLWLTKWHGTGFFPIVPRCSSGSFQQFKAPARVWDLSERRLVFICRCLSHSSWTACPLKMCPVCCPEALVTTNPRSVASEKNEDLNSPPNQKNKGVKWAG